MNGFKEWYDKYYAFNFDLDAPDRAKVFSWQQILLCLGIAAICIIALVILSRRSRRAQTIALYVSASLIAVLELWRYIWLGTMRYKAFTIEIFHFNLCNILAVFIPLSVLVFKNRTCYAASCVYGLIAGIVVLIYPRDVVNGNYLLHCSVVQSLISHALFAVVAILLIMTGKYKPNVNSDFWRCGLFFIGCTLLAKFMVITLDNGENYLFMKELDLWGLDFMPFVAYYPLLLTVVWCATALALWVMQSVVQKLTKTEESRAIS